MPLFKSHSPSRASLSIPISATQSATSPTSSRSQSPGEEHHPGLGLGKSAGNMQDETFRNVKLVEELLRAWNEHRQALSACAKSGKRLAKAMDELGQGADKTSIISQTLRPTAAVIEGCADATGRWAKRADKEYEAINTESGRYFSLLAKETRSHDAYRSGVTKRHSQAAYRKSARSVTDTSSTHAALLHLQHTLAADVQRADADHIALLTAKQSTLLLSLAAHSGALGTGMTNHHSECLKRAASGYKDIEYFRVLAESRWSGRIPDDLEERAESEAREVMRIQKARVAMGELDIVGQGIWDNIALRPRMGRVVSESVLAKSSPTSRPPYMSQASGLSQASNSTTRTSYFTGAGTGTESSMTSMSSATTVTSPGTSKGSGSWGDMMSPSHAPEPSTSTTRPLPIPKPTQQQNLDPPRFVPGHGVRSTSVSMPTPRRSVSQIAADLEALAQPSPSGNLSGPETPPTTNHHTPSHTGGSNRRVTMPPVYSQPGGPLSHTRGAGGYTIPIVQPRRASVHVKPPGEYPSPPDKGVASPTPKRPVRMSTMGMGFDLADR